MGRKIVLATAGGLVLVCGGLVLARRPVAAWLLESYLATRGVTASIQIDRLNYSGASARFRIGPPSAPVLRVENIAVSFAWQGWSPNIAAVNIDRPSLRLEFDGKRISFGALQNLIGTNVPQQQAQPRTRSTATTAPAQQMPAVSVKDSRLWVVTPDGTIEASGSGAFADGRLTQLDAVVQPVTIKLRNLSAELQSARIWTKAPGHLHATARGTVTAGTAAKAVRIRGGVLALEAGALRLHAIPNGGISVSGRIGVQVRADQFIAGGATIMAPSARFDVSGSADTAGRLDIAATLTADGGMTTEDAQAQLAKLPALGTVPAARDALIAALQHFMLQIGSVHVQRANEETDVSMRAPAELTGGNAAKLTLASRNSALFHADARGWRGAGDFALRGTQLPEITLAIPNYSWTETANGNAIFDAAVHLAAKANLAGARGVSLDADGRVSTDDGDLRIVLDRCAGLQIAAVMQKGHSVLRNGRVRLCGQPRQPIFSTQPGGWRWQAQWKALSVQLVSAQALATGSEGRIALSSEAGSTSGTVDAAHLRLNDQTRARRFEPITAAGWLTLADNFWRGRFAISGTKQDRLGTVTLVHAMRTGRGRAAIDLDGIAFSPNRAQPGDLSLLLAPLARADGKASFTGEIAWTARGMTSGGDLVFQKFGFASPMGQVHDAEGHIHFISLAPLHTAADQIVKATKIDWTIPLTGISSTFEMTPTAFMLSTAQADMASGQINLEPVKFVLPTDHTTQGKIYIRGIDIGTLVAASNLGKKIKLTARVSGTVPFRYGPAGLQFTDGRIATVGPGRLSIARSLWTGAEEPAASVGAVRDFAYQAMEDLAIDRLEGTINSLPKGRLGMIFRIKGRYDPKKAGTPSINLFELLQGTALDRPIPLPKGTDVSLTLDTTLNFDELLAAYRKAWADALARDAATQPATDHGRKSK